MLKLATSIVCILIVLGLYKNKQLISSSTMWIFCYLLIFIVYPIYSLTEFAHEELIDLLSLIGILVFYFGHSFAKKFNFKFNDKKNIKLKKELVFPEFKVSLFFFIVLFIISIYTIIRIIGFGGIVSVLKGALTSKSLILGNSSSNIITFSLYLLFPCVVCMWVSSNTKLQKICSLISLFIFVIETSLFEYTRIFLITIVAIIFFYEVRNMKSKRQAVLAFGTLISAIVLMVFMNYIRCMGLARATEFSDYVNIDYIFESTDFGASYKWFDRLLDYDDIFINPIVYLKPLYAFVPRSIWMNKPEPMSLQILKIINPSLAAAGYSTAGNSVLGEGYALIGYFGMFFNCFLWGFICEKFDLHYRKRIENGRDSSLLNLYYYIFAIFVVISGQRGDWSQYMTIVLWFYFLPMYIFSKLRTRKDMRVLKNEEQY